MLLSLKTVNMLYRDLISCGVALGILSGALNQISFADTFLSVFLVQSLFNIWVFLYSLSSTFHTRSLKEFLLHCLVLP